MEFDLFHCFLRNYAKTLYLVSLIRARKKWQRTATRMLNDRQFAQAAIAIERADVIAVELRRLIKNFPDAEATATRNGVKAS